MASKEEQKRIVAAIRDSNRADPPKPIRQIQARFPDRKEVKGAVWISIGALAAPIEDDCRRALFEVLQASKNGDEHLPSSSEIPLESVYVEWVGHWHGVPFNSPQPQLSEEWKFKRLEEQTEHSVTVLYFHGGSFTFGNPVWARPSTTTLAKLTRGKIASVGYRVSPQHQFPAALLDGLVAYLNLLYAPPGSTHPQIPAESIVFAADSAGGNLSLGLVQFILRLRALQDTADPKVRFNGASVSVPMPRGVAVHCPWADLSLSVPSWLAKDHIDYLQNLQPWLQAEAPSDDVWPTKPPRGDTYCDTSAFQHPFVSPMLATDWRGAPPMWITCGEERLSDATKIVAMRAANQGVPVQFAIYEGLPHNFCPVLRGFPQSKSCYQEWARVLVQFQERKPVSTRGKFVLMPGNVEAAIDVTKMIDITHEEALQMVKQAAARRPIWTGNTATKALL